jgi:hypothetical protein
MEEMREDEFSRDVVPRDASSAMSGGRAARDDRDGGADQEEVRRRAYERYLARGDGPGDEENDWLEAEREVRSASVAPVRARRETKDR